MFKDFIVTQADNDSLKVGSIEWVVPSEQVDGYKVEGFFRLYDARPSLDVFTLPDETYPVGSNNICTKATEVDGMVHLLVWVDEGGPYRQTQVETQSKKKK